MILDDWGGSIEVHMSDPSPEERARYQQMLEQAGRMGYQVRLNIRRVARQAGLTSLPGCTIYVNGEPHHSPAEDLTVLLPGEED